MPWRAFHGIVILGRLSGALDALIEFSSKLTKKG
jgi:hypothetical protein